MGAYRGDEAFFLHFIIDTVGALARSSGAGLRRVHLLGMRATGRSSRASWSTWPTSWTFSARRVAPMNATAARTAPATSSSC
ncbi:MAG: hypothetical protein R3A10_12755 [Caldilineaceae bacterium]